MGNDADSGAAEAHYHRLVEASPYGVFVLDADGSFTELNPAGERILGRSSSDVLGRPFETLIAPGSLEAAREAFRTVITGSDESHEVDVHIQRPSGEERQVSITITAIVENGEVTGVHGVSRDITEERRTQEALHRSEERFRALVENVQDAITVLNADASVRYASPAFERITGFSVRERVGRSAFDRVHPEDVDDARRAYRDLIERDGATVRIEPRIQHKDGSWRTVELIGKNLLAEPAVRGVVVTYRDITEHRQLALRLRQAQKMEAVGRLAGGIAHDFNNLLSIIGGTMQLLLSEAPEEGPLRKDLEEVWEASQRASSLTRQLLAFSRQQVLQAEVVDLNAIIERMGWMLRRMLGEDIRIVERLDPDLGPTRADPSQVEQILLNIAINARDAMPTGGTLTTTTRNVEIDTRDADRYDYPVEVGPYVSVSVRDTGEGMPRDVRQRIFEPFFTTKPRGKGTGLGLSTVYGIVKQSGGYVWVDSQLGEGTTVSVYLPRLEQVSTGPERRAEPEHAVRQGSGVILVAEDEPGVRRVVRRMLEHSGYHTLEAATGAEAIQVSDDHAGPIDLLLTDVVMPGMSGPDLAAYLTRSRPPLKVLFTSGYTDEEIGRHRVREHGAGFIQKPYEREELIAKVRELLEG